MEVRRSLSRAGQCVRPAKGHSLNVVMSAVPVKVITRHSP